MSFEGRTRPGLALAVAAVLCALLVPGVVRAAVRNTDFNNDGKSDVLWRHTGGGLYVWLMNGPGLAGSTFLAPIGLTWMAQGIGDFDGNGTADILWREATSGATYIWFMNGATVTGSGYTSSGADNTWAIQDVADLNGDGKADILWRHTTGALYIWLMNGTTVGAGSAFLPAISASWQIKALADFNGDGRADILWRESGGSTYIWFMQGATVASSGYTASTTDNGWIIQGTGDLNGDGKADIVWRHTSGATYVWMMDGLALVPGTGYLPFVDTSWQIQALRDFSGDGKVDVLWRHTGGATYLWTMNGTSATSAAYTAGQADNNWMAQPLLSGFRGMPQSGFPSYNERVVHVLVNRARSDPQTELASCAACAEKACYAPTAPLGWALGLNRSARFHSGNLLRSGSILQHDSPCTLVTDISSKYLPNGTCQGETACSCQAGTFPCSGAACTSAQARVNLFGPVFNGENAAQGFGDPGSVFTAWITEPDSSAACGFRLTNGHRYNILNGSSGSMGVGHDPSFWTQDFGTVAPPTHLVAGSHWNNEYLANWYTPSAAPASASVNVDGACTAMTLQRGTSANGTWRATVSGAGCRRYYFQFVDAGGQTQTLPETGSYGVGCPEDWSPVRPRLCGSN